MIVVDTTYLLPFFGVEIAGITEEEVLSLSSHCELIYSSMLLPELWAKVLRETGRRGLAEPPEVAMEALRALLAGTDVRLEPPSPKQMEVAALLRLSGHRDIFDCLGFGAAESLSTDFLSEDSELRKFISEVKERYDLKSRVLTLEELIARLG